MFLWRCSLNNLPTGENLRKRGLLSNTLCSKCGAEETLVHILFQCETAVKVWELCPWSVPLDLRSCSSFRDALQSSGLRTNLPPVGAISNLFPWICWGLWLNRNRLTFENKQTAPSEILSTAICLMKEWERAQSPHDPRPLTQPPQIPIQLSSPMAIICNTDAAWNKDTRDAGLPWIFSNHSGLEINRGCSHQQHVSSPLMAEALAIREALGHAISLNINIIWLCSDCKGLTHAISANQRSVELFGVLSDIESLLVSFFLLLSRLLCF